MPRDLKKINWNAVEKFFYKAMLQGFVAGAKPELLPAPFSRFKQHVFARGPYQLVDKWCTTPGSDVSGGMTVIFFDRNHGSRNASMRDYVPIWQMHYGGPYKKEAIPLVREALKEEYSKPKEFCGCRGPAQLVRGGMTYVNMPNEDLLLSLLKPEDEHSFRSFSGLEEVHDAAAGYVGYHRYFGYALV